MQIALPTNVKIYRIPCSSWPMVKRIFVHAKGIYRAATRSSWQYKTKHVFYNTTTQQVTGLLYDISDNKHFECSFLLLSIPLSENGDLVDLQCKCGNVPEKDNSCQNHFCVHFAHLLRYLVDRTQK